MKTVCPNCHHSEIEGSLFCSECGTSLITQDGLSTAAIPGGAVRLADEKNIAPPKPPPSVAVDADASLHIVRTGQILPLIGREEYTIGRVSEGQSILPDIDLTPYEAFTLGVSRLHATLKITNDALSIIDLGSSNGTRVNNLKITPHKEHSVNHGDIIALGQLKIQALVRQE
ncbi:MAG: FHA domain-containing protein [Anaerolineae bacterium]|nr:FHA domain-containing protein [Anaerolineae bacterium]